MRFLRLLLVGLTELVTVPAILLYCLFLEQILFLVFRYRKLLLSLLLLLLLRVR